ncbi:GNAT family N-acetyltransferase [Haloplanus salinus]|uniref:GNAT family N-acetyltransferase n=1 Tax=Haloplanus salinus TaxID=1126245 RepID=A0A368N7G4_9EURY|nr:GNAT family N-acetyltransferase [Haloplanus salinus]RCU46146.1 GNAT family N-acetyltransferase [Haloplanus salinus]
MDIRDATAADIGGIRAVAHDSLAASYGHVLEDDIIAQAVERWYDEETLVDDLDDRSTEFLVAADDGTIVGFAQSYVVDRREVVGEIDWLHVEPGSRGGGVGDELLAALESRLMDHGVSRIEGRVLEANEAGAGFYEREEFEGIGDRTVDIGGEPFVEKLYSKFPETGGRQVLTEAATLPDGRQVFVALDESVRGSDGPFYAVYLDRDRSERYGYLCGNCDGFGISMDTMGRVVCNECENRRKPTRWDASYL